ncbi:hypothetical protein A4A49_60722, partial [Nicotiana attenuata]
KFGLQVQAECVFCGQHEENFEHLFFKYQYTRTLLERMLNWLGYRRQIQNWEQEVNWISSVAKKKDCVAEMTMAVFAMVVYCIWRERNMIRFEKGRYDADRVCKEIAMHIHIQG